MFNENEKGFDKTVSGGDNADKKVLENPEKNTDVQDNTDKKLFTQEEVDALIKVRLARAAKAAKEADTSEIKTLREEAEKNNSIISDLRAKADDAAQRLLAYELKDKILKRGVEPKFADFALFEIKKDISAGIDFDDAFERFCNENDFSVKEKSTTGLKQGGTITSMSAVEDSFYKINPTLK
ncbi:MAG: hypothetical protein SPF92_02675 [Clostridia bacterium]|nr:hypothetical protein [Clostridia bacterium]